MTTSAHDDLLLTGDLLARGHCHDDLRRWVSSGDLVRVTRGVYAQPETLSTARDERYRREHALATKALLTRFGSRAAASHHSGAVLHGLDVWGVNFQEVQLTRLADLKNRNRSDLRIHQACPGQRSELVDGFPVLSVADCVVGTGLGAPRSLPMSALIAADCALRRGLVTRDQLDEAVARFKGYRAIGPVRAALVHADGRHESPAETRNAGVLREMGLAFTPQVVHRVDGKEYRVDAQLDDHPVIIEVDGFAKYYAALMADGVPADEALDRALRQEKLREDRLRSLGIIVVRVTWRDLARPGEIMRRVRVAIDQSKRLPRLGG